MIYPEFIRKNEVIGISAPSAGVGKKIDDFERSLAVLRKRGWQIKETASVRLNSDRGGDAETRGKELTSLFKDPEVRMVMAAAGGDFLLEMVPYVNWNVLKKHPKWLMGMSDPTGILFPYVTNCDVAAFYGLNGGSYDIEPLPKFVKNNLEIISGNLIEQKSFSKYMKTPGFLAEKIEFDTPARWQCTEKTLDVSGRCIGGCIDVLKDLIGTPYDGTKKFIKKYQDDGIIWFFDNFSLGAEVFYRTLLQMKYTGWFEHTNAVLMGRVLFESSDTGMTYEDALKKALPGIPVVYQADVGHTLPHMTLIMGSVMNLKYADHKGSISFQLR
jgi:muramoyltetrapeptide carboxypeptidase LdcA involved in peptidoglycan recycling